MKRSYMCLSHGMNVEVQVLEKTEEKMRTKSAFQFSHRVIVSFMGEEISNE